MNTSGDFSDNFYIEGGYNRTRQIYNVNNNQFRFADYRVDVNRTLPGGGANPNFGKPYADLGARLNGSPFPIWQPVRIAAGDQLSFSPETSNGVGVRAYLCVAGGLTIPPVLGSRGAAGEMVLFDRSWYNRAGVERVMGFCPEELVKRFLTVVPPFEKMMLESGIILLKYWLEVSPEEQTRRLTARIDDPRKIWKLSPMDLKSYDRWDDYTRARDEMFAATHTAISPWYVVESNDKKKVWLFGDLCVSAQNLIFVVGPSELHLASADTDSIWRAAVHAGGNARAPKGHGIRASAQGHPRDPRT